MSDTAIKEFYRKHATKTKVTARILKIASFIPGLIPGKKVLDVGCGSKVLTTCMQVYAYVTAIDIDEDIYKWDSGKKYDVVTCFDVLEHLPDVPRAIERLRYFCKEGGLILVNLPEHQDKSQPIDNLVALTDILNLGKLVYLENYKCTNIESYNFMVFER